MVIKITIVLPNFKQFLFIDSGRMQFFLNV